MFRPPRQSSCPFHQSFVFLIVSTTGRSRFIFLFCTYTQHIVSKHDIFSPFQNSIMTQRMPIGNLPRAPPPRAPSSSTACAFEKGDFVWTIDPFNMQCVGLFRIESTEFSPTNNSTKWILSLNDKGVWLEHPVRSLFNSPTSRPTQEPIQVKTSFVNARRQRVFINEIFVDKGTAMPIRVNTIDKHTLLQQVNSLIVDGKITILCHIQTCQKRATVSASMQVLQIWKTKKNC